jgi:hypothetical protein
MSPPVQTDSCHHTTLRIGDSALTTFGVLVIHSLMTKAQSEKVRGVQIFSPRNCFTINIYMELMDITLDIISVIQLLK